MHAVLCICRWMFMFVVNRPALFKFIFAGIGNSKYSDIRPADVFLGLYLCGCMPFIPFISGVAIYSLYGINWAIFAFLLGSVCAPLIIKIIWKTGITIMLIGANKSEAG